MIYKYSQLTNKLAYSEIVEEKKHRHLHSGQAKLLFSEILFLTKYYAEDAIVLYVGAAAGYHIPNLSDLFPKLTFHLYDPSRFGIKPTDKIKIFNKKFTDDIALSYANKRILFISDIRTFENIKDATEEEYDRIIDTDMSWQLSWVKIINPIAASLKFKLVTTPGQTNYFDGTIYLQPYNRQSAEARLIVTNTQKFKSYDNAEYDEKNVYFNWRTRLEFKSIELADIMKKYSIANNWDNAYALFIMLYYCQKFSCKNPIDKFISTAKLFVKDNVLFNN